MNLGELEILPLEIRKARALQTPRFDDTLSFKDMHQLIRSDVLDLLRGSGGPVNLDGRGLF